MKVRVLADDCYRILAVMSGQDCPVEDFLRTGEEATEASRRGLLYMLEVVSRQGLSGLPSAWTHEANKVKGIYEFRKGRLRLFYFKGAGRDIAVCTSGVLKDGPKADRPSVERAGMLRAEYFSALQKQSIEVVNDDSE